MSNHRIADYSLLILDTLARNCQSIDELHHAISRYPEDHKEGAVVQDMTGFVSRHGAFAEVRAAIEQELSRRGGREALEGMSDSMALSEFIDGWDEVLLARAPFASSSYEPRFAIEDYLSPRTIAAGLRLLPRMLYQVDMDEAPHAVYGHLVVLPKWFEIHK